MQELIYQIKTRNIEPAKLSEFESTVFFIGALVLPLVLAVGGVIGAVSLVSKSKLEDAGALAVASTPLVRSASSGKVQAPAVALASQGNIASLPVAQDDGLALKYERNLTYSALFLNGKSRLGPAGRAKAQEIASNMGALDVVDLYGYAGVNSAKDTKFQTNTAIARAVSMKLNLVDNGVDPQKVKVIDPSSYLFSQALPEDPKQVRAEVYSKNSDKAINHKNTFLSEEVLGKVKPQ